MKIIMETLKTHLSCFCVVSFDFKQCLIFKAIQFLCKILIFVAANGL